MNKQVVIWLNYWCSVKRVKQLAIINGTKLNFGIVNQLIMCINVLKVPESNEGYDLVKEYSRGSNS